MEKECLLTNNCSFAGIRPAMADLPYPPIQVTNKNQAYANLLSIDYCGAVSELSAITQYINNENRLSCSKCSIAKTILGIAIAEMMHLQKLGELVFLLGGDVSFTAKYQNGGAKPWTPAYLSIPGDARKMLVADIEAEKAAIKQYRVHIQMIKDNCVNAVLERIIKDEEYHIMLLQVLLKEL
ncbi:MAG: rubrerythrin family protein [Lachnospiraceae bacterium]|nr:rubrerythrin family protein [Lachnospiraceae bacterium]